jgi:hypothetical protein
MNGEQFGSENKEKLQASRFKLQANTIAFAFELTAYCLRPLGFWLYLRVACSV